MNQVGAQLERDHDDLNQLLLQLSQDVDSPCVSDLQATWSALETRLLAHMDAEEHYLLPLVEVSHPSQAERTRAEHAQIRQLVSEIGLTIDLHTARAPRIFDLVRLLQEHAKREDETLYCLAGEKASSAVQHRIAAMLKAAARVALAAASRVARSALPPPSGRVSP